MEKASHAGEGAPSFAGMKTFPRLLALLFSLAAVSAVSAAPPVVSNIRASQIAGTKNVEILYDVSDADGDALTIGAQVSGDAGATYTIPATALSGQVGAGVGAGLNRRIVWNAGADWNGQFVGSAKVRVTASDGTTPAPPPGMVYIPAGVFQMGDNLDGDGNALPVHNVTLNAFFMDRFEVSKEIWMNVLTWASANGYTFVSYDFKAAGHPVRYVTWYDAVKWCNARSQKEGLTPVYYTDDAQTLVYMTGNANITNAQVKWTANGYRLPTEAEWEKAARGGALGQRYPWGNTINGSQANYSGSGDVFESGTAPATTPVGYYNGSQLPSGIDMANGYGLYDMAGNVEEWCWDWHSSTYYGDSTANNNPRGPASGSNRVLRGGTWNNAAANLRCAYRSSRVPQNYTGYPSFGGYDGGVRCVRGL